MNLQFPVLLVCLSAWLLAAIAHAQVPARGSYAFLDVNVVPLDAERVLAGQTVVADGRIVAMGASGTIVVPADAARIDGRGRYLMPGIAEMHGHIPFSNEDGQAEDTLFLYVAAGATTVRGMQGHESQLELRQRVEAGEIVGPRLVLAAPSLGGNNVPDARTAERLVREAKGAGFDLLKVHEGLSADAYSAIVQTATELDLPWGGHVSVNVGVPGALAAGQATIDHLDDYLDAMQPEGSPALDATGAERQRLLPLNADPATMPRLARDTREAGVAVVPTQILWEVLRGARDPETLLDRPENRYMDRTTLAQWTEAATASYRNANRDAARREAALRQQLLKTMSDEGVTILMGTDAPQIFSVPGFSLHRELPLMAESGMSAYEVLRTGTTNVAGHLGTEADAGTVAVGKRADLVLVVSNPLVVVGAGARIAGVLIDGGWLSAAAFRRGLDAIAATHRR
jgi:imidazolonepropionase-like amidohydrolase